MKTVKQTRRGAELVVLTVSLSIIALLVVGFGLGWIWKFFPELLGWHNWYLSVFIIMVFWGVYNDSFRFSLLPVKAALIINTFDNTMRSVGPGGNHAKLIFAETHKVIDLKVRPMEISAVAPARDGATLTIGPLIEWRADITNMVPYLKIISEGIDPLQEALSAAVREPTMTWVSSFKTAEDAQEDLPMLVKTLGDRLTGEWFYRVEIKDSEAAAPTKVWIADGNLKAAHSPSKMFDHPLAKGKEAIIGVQVDIRENAETFKDDNGPTNFVSRRVSKGTVGMISSERKKKPGMRHPIANQFGVEFLTVAINTVEYDRVTTMSREGMKAVELLEANSDKLEALGKKLGMKGQELLTFIMNAEGRATVTAITGNVRPLVFDNATPAGKP